MWLIGAGITGLVLSSILTKSFLNRANLPDDSFEFAAGRGVVPSWVSLLNLSSWLVLGFGVVTLFV